MNAVILLALKDTFFNAEIINNCQPRVLIFRNTHNTI